MSKQINKGIKFENQIIEFKVINFLPEELNQIVKKTFNPYLENNSKEHMNYIVNICVPDFIARNGQKNDQNLRNAYVIAIEENPTLAFEHFEHYKQRNFIPETIDEIVFKKPIHFSFDENKMSKQIIVSKISNYSKNDSIQQRLLKTDFSELEIKLNEKVIGQEKIISNMIDWLRIIKSGALSNSEKLICGFLMGPSGVGKTSLIKSLAEITQTPYKKFPCSEYGDMYDDKRLLGSTQGLIGYDEKGGPLAQFITENPYGIALFDEIEKMHPYVFKALTVFLDNGETSDGKGNLHKFNGLVYFTSNIGNTHIDSKNAIGFSNKTETQIDVERRLEQMKLNMPYEMRGRINEFFLFDYLSNNALESILNSYVEQTNEGFMYGNISLDKNAKSKIIELGSDKETGARNLHNIYLKNIIVPLITQLERNKIETKTEDELLIRYEDNHFCYKDKKL